MARWFAERSIAWCGLGAALLFLPLFADAQSPAWQQAAVRSEDTTASAYARQLAQLINDYRAGNGLGPLELVADLNALAAEHSAQMAEQRRLSHDGFRGRFDRTTARLCVENVGFNFPHAAAQMDGWRASPGHHRNLLDPKLRQMGIAQSRAFVTFFACG